VDGDRAEIAKDEKETKMSKTFNHDRGSGGFDRMISAAVNVLLAVGVSVCVFLVAWWLVRKL
jgi:hypothetical protein